MRKILAVGALVLTTSSLALAGAKASSPVSIDTTYRFASGSIGSARNSSDGWQAIGCGVYTAPGQSYVSCSATTAKAQNATCYSFDPEMVKAGMSIGTDSSVTFQWHETNGTCTQLNITNNSRTEPKAP